MKLYLQRKRFDVDFCYPLVPAEDSTGFPLKARFRFQNPEVLLPQLVPKRLSAHRRFEAQKTPPNPIPLSLFLYSDLQGKPFKVGADWRTVLSQNKTRARFLIYNFRFLSVAKTSNRKTLCLTAAWD